MIYTHISYCGLGQVIVITNSVSSSTELNLFMCLIMSDKKEFHTITERKNKKRKLRKNKKRKLKPDYDATV